MKGASGSSKLSFGSRDVDGLRILITLVLVAIVIVTLYAREGLSGPIHITRSVVKTATMPFDWVGSQLERPFDALGHFIRNASSDNAEIVELERRNSELVQLLAELNEYKLENARLQQLLQLTGAYGASGIGARVLTPNQSEWRDSMTIDKGLTSGIAVDMPVLSGTGVLGQVSSVSAGTSEVRLLTDSESKVSALLQSSRATGVLSGSIDGSLHLEFIPTTTSVTIGEIVVTSGLGGVYPKGLPIGVVSNIAESSSSLYYDIAVTPIANVENQEEVIVVTQYSSTVAQQTAEVLLTTGTVPGAEQTETPQIQGVPMAQEEDAGSSEDVSGQSAQTDEATYEQTDQQGQGEPAQSESTQAGDAASSESQEVQAEGSTGVPEQDVPTDGVDEQPVTPTVDDTVAEGV